VNNVIINMQWRVLCLLALVAVAHGARLPDDDIGSEDVRSLPVVLWHGMGDSCCSLGSIGSVKKLIEDNLGVFVHSIATGTTEYSDIWSSFFGNLNDQVATVCTQLKGLKELKKGFNAVGFSQGGQFLRAVVERCGHELPPIHTLITLGAQHQGVMNAPGCRSDTAGAAGKACSMMHLLLGHGAYAPWVRTNIIQAQYFKDPNDLELYLTSNIFLPDVNNEHVDKNEQYAENLASLERLVLFRFENDTTVVPRDSAWFSFYNGTDLLALRDQPIYTDDWIGLKQIDEKGGLILDSAPGEHMQFNLKWFMENVVEKYLAGASPSSAQ